MSDSFIFYKSFYDAANQAPDDATKHEILWHLVEVCLGIKTVNDIPFPASAVAVQALANVESAKLRYGKAVSDGKKGGRPRKWIDRAEAERIFAETQSWQSVAEKLNVSEDTLYRARMKWKKDTAKPAKPQNLNVYVNDSVYVSDNVNESDTINSNKKGTPDTTTTDPNGSPSRPTRERVLEWCPPD